MNGSRLLALFLRHTYPLRRDFDLLSDMIYWPLIDTVLWGVTGQWLAESTGTQQLIVALLTSLVLWNVIWRSQSEVARNLIDEIWNNNLINMFATPLKVSEWIVSVLLLSVFKTAITLTVLIPVIFLLYRINVFHIGWWFIPFYLCTTFTGWWIGFISAGIVIREGPKMQTVVWTLPGILLPFSAVYFPLIKLPAFIQPISRLVPTTYVFESLRSLLFTGTINSGMLLLSFGLNVLYLCLSILFFLKSFQKSRQLGLGRFN